MSEGLQHQENIGVEPSEMLPEAEGPVAVMNAPTEQYEMHMQALTEMLQETRGTEVTIKEVFYAEDIVRSDGSRSVIWNGKETRSDGFDDDSQNQMKERGFMVYAEHNSGSVYLDTETNEQGDQITKYRLIQFEDVPTKVDAIEPDFSSDEHGSSISLPEEVSSEIDTEPEIQASTYQERPWFLEYMFNNKEDLSQTVETKDVVATPPLKTRRDSTNELIFSPVYTSDTLASPTALGPQPANLEGGVSSAEHRDNLPTNRENSTFETFTPMAEIPPLQSGNYSLKEKSSPSPEANNAERPFTKNERLPLLKETVIVETAGMASIAPSEKEDTPIQKVSSDVQTQRDSVVDQKHQENLPVDHSGERQQEVPHEPKPLHPSLNNMEAAEQTKDFSFQSGEISRDAVATPLQQIEKIVEPEEIMTEMDTAREDSLAVSKPQHELRPEINVSFTAAEVAHLPLVEAPVAIDIFDRPSHQSSARTLPDLPLTTFFTDIPAATKQFEALRASDSRPVEIVLVGEVAPDGTVLDATVVKAEAGEITYEFRAAPARQQLFSAATTRQMFEHYEWEADSRSELLFAGHAEAGKRGAQADERELGAGHSSLEQRLEAEFPAREYAGRLTTGPEKILAERVKSPKSINIVIDVEGPRQSQAPSLRETPSWVEVEGNRQGLGFFPYGNSDDAPAATKSTPKPVRLQAGGTLT